jgi:uncharacterized membrane protein (DUF485 family)
MPALDHAPLPEEPRDPVGERRNARIGLILFAIYSSFYTAFVLVNAFAPDLMDTVLPGDLNAAVVAGFLLILGAAILAVVYARLCRKPHGGGA